MGGKVVEWTEEESVRLVNELKSPARKTLSITKLAEELAKTDLFAGRRTAGAIAQKASSLLVDMRRQEIERNRTAGQQPPGRKPVTEPVKPLATVGEAIEVKGRRLFENVPPARPPVGGFARPEETKTADAESKRLLPPEGTGVPAEPTAPVVPTHVHEIHLVPGATRVEKTEDGTAMLVPEPPLTAALTHPGPCQTSASTPVGETAEPSPPPPDEPPPEEEQARPDEDSRPRFTRLLEPEKESVSAADDEDLGLRGMVDAFSKELTDLFLGLRPEVLSFFIDFRSNIPSEAVLALLDRAKASVEPGVTYSVAVGITRTKFSS